MPVPNQNLTPHFTLHEMLESQAAVRPPRIDEQFEPTALIIANLQSLCENVLEPLRTRLGQPVSVSSGFRCPRLNARIGGAKKSQHMRGEAADFRVWSMSVEELFQFIKNSDLPYDQLIQEFDHWVHVSFGPNPRHQSLRAVSGQTKLLPG